MILINIDSLGFIRYYFYNQEKDSILGIKFKQKFTFILNVLIIMICLISSDRNHQLSWQLDLKTESSDPKKASLLLSLSHNWQVLTPGTLQRWFSREAEDGSVYKNLHYGMVFKVTFATGILKYPWSAHLCHLENHSVHWRL